MSSFYKMHAFLPIFIIASFANAGHATCWLPITCPPVPIEDTNFVLCNTSGYADNDATHNDGYANLFGNVDGFHVDECVPVNPARGDRSSSGRTLLTFLCGDTHRWFVLAWSRNQKLPIVQADTEVEVTLFDGLKVKVKDTAKEFCNVYTPDVDPRSERVTGTGDCGPQAVSLTDDCKI